MAEDGLPLPLLVGEDCLAHGIQRLHDEKLKKALFLVNSLLRFIIESGDDGGWYASGVWQLLRQLASAFLEQIGAQTGPPVLSYREVVIGLCHALP
jgi:hypothetical protein